MAPFVPEDEGIPATGPAWSGDDDDLRAEYEWTLSGGQQGPQTTESNPFKRDKGDRPERQLETSIHRSLIEIPLSIGEKNNLIFDRRVRMSVDCSAPPSTTRGRWTARFGGCSVIDGELGSTEGSFGVSYDVAPKTKLHADANIGKEQKAALSATWSENASNSIRVSCFASSTTKPYGDQGPGFSFEAKEKLGLFKLSSSCLITPTTPYRVMLSLATLTTHKVTLGLGYSSTSDQHSFLQLKFAPKLNKLCNTNFNLRLDRQGLWEFGGTFFTNVPSKLSSFSMGVWRLSSQQIAWVLCFQHKEMTVRLPILFGNIATSLSPHNANFFLFMKLYAVSGILSDFMTKVTGLDKLEAEEAKLKEQQLQLNRTKALEDALAQKELMIQQARKRERAENQKQGLVVLEATYHVEGGDSLDVRVQLQFWVVHSKLELAATSKKNLLGFYDVGLQVATSKDADAAPRTQSSKSWWERLWMSPEDDEPVEKILPTLTVKYQYGGDIYTVSCQDDEALTLPSPRAVKHTLPPVE